MIIRMRKETGTTKQWALNSMPQDLEEYLAEKKAEGWELVALQHEVPERRTERRRKARKTGKHTLSRQTVLRAVERMFTRATRETLTNKR